MIAILIAAAKKVGIAPALLIAVCHTETNLTNVHNLDDRGSASYGVCQMKEGTARWMAKVRGYPEMAKWTGKDLADPKKNAKAAAIYLKYQLDRYDGNWCAAIAAYNAGSAVESKKAPGKPRNYKYVKKVKSKIEQDREIASLLICEDYFDKEKGEDVERNP